MSARPDGFPCNLFARLSPAHQRLAQWAPSSALSTLERLSRSLCAPICSRRLIPTDSTDNN